MATKRILIQATSAANSKALESFHLCDEQQLDSSKIVAKDFIARGSYASVYRGFYGDRDVAIKVLDWGEDDQSMETLMLRKSFREEVLVWCDLDHPNISKGIIVAFIGATLGTCHEIESGKMDNPKNVCCVVTDYQPCGTLRSYLSKHQRNRLNFKTVVRISLELAKGLSYLHSEKVVHRDIKPENILLDKNKTVKICDFGVARPEVSERNVMTRHQTIQNPNSGVARRNTLNRNQMTEQTGTIGYMAPEVFVGEAYTRKCDVFSFGICLWEIYSCDMAYKRLPLDENTYPDIYKNLRPDMPSCCPKSLRNVMERCWDSNPNKRPEMEEVVSMLETIDASRKRWFKCFSGGFGDVVFPTNVVVGDA